MTQKTINVVCAADDNYAPLCGIMLTSLLEAHRGVCHVEAYILTAGFNARNARLLEAMARGYDARIHVVRVDDSLFDDCPIRRGDHVSLAAYFRFLIPSLLPAAAERAVYLDCDILVRGSLLPLFETPLDGAALAACMENYVDEYIEHARRLGYPVAEGYFNSGVLLIDLTFWRTHGVAEQLFRYVADDPARCLFHDQDALNGVLHDRKKVLPAKYNVYSHRLLRGRFSPADREEFLGENPVVVHYCTPDKPWDWYLADFPFRAEWERARQLSPWKSWGGVRPWKERLRRRLLQAVKRLVGKDARLYVEEWKIWA